MKTAISLPLFFFGKKQIINQCALRVSQGRVVGITIGCIIGMFPLLLMGKDAKKVDEDEK